MKNKGDRSAISRARDEELVRLFFDYQKKSPEKTKAEIISAIISGESSRFWVMPERALNVVSLLQKGLPLGDVYPQRLLMYREIYRRVVEMRELLPQSPLINLVKNVVVQKAPSFYITFQSAKTIIYRALRRHLLLGRIK
jgi:hypothetical protein